MSEYKLTAEIRQPDLKASQVRANELVPASLYGHKVDPVAVSLPAAEFNKVFQKAGRSSLVEITLGDSKKAVLFKEPQYNPVTGEVIHIDLFAVNMTETIKAEIPLVFENEAPALDTGEATLVTNKDKLEVECLPSKLPHDLKVDLSSLANIDDAIHVKDVKLPEGVEVLNDPEDIIVLVAQQREEEPEPEVSEEEAIAAVEATSEKEEGDAATEASE
ncbi:MAG: 50S ribosomal protein L25 [Patescibacteria group bacterium]